MFIVGLDVCVQAFAGIGLPNHKFHTNILFKVIIEGFIIIDDFNISMLRIGIEAKLSPLIKIFLKKLIDLISGLSNIGLGVAVEVEEEGEDKEVFCHIVCKIIA